MPASLGSGAEPRQCCCVELACGVAADAAAAAAAPCDPPPARCLPSIVIAGTQKAGTTAFAGMLLAHTGVAPAAEKEVHFFDSKVQRDGSGQELVAEYLQSFPPLTATPSAASNGGDRDAHRGSWGTECARRWSDASDTASHSITTWVTAAFHFRTLADAVATLCSLRMEATPAYVTKPTLPARLGAALPRDVPPNGWDGGGGRGWGGSTVIVTLRDPTQRALSE